MSIGINADLAPETKKSSKVIGHRKILAKNLNKKQI
jgi:hypothetical protein